MKVSRRQCVALVGASAALVPTIAAAASVQRSATLVGEPETSPALVLSASSLLAPLAVGSHLGRWRVENMGRFHAGAVSVQLSNASGQRYFVDICARDYGMGAPIPPARTDLCDLFVANEGSGHDPTIEDQGLAAMALAGVLRSNEHSADLRGLLTLRNRLANHGDCVVRRCVEG